MRDLANVGTFKSRWPVFEPEIRKILGPKPTGHDVFLLGSKLSEIFREASEAGRTQSMLSGGGSTWECLVVWYLNLIAFGTDLIAAKTKKASVPEVITDAICVTLQGYPTTSESDVIVYSIPNAGLLGAKITVRQINEQIMSDTRKCAVAIVQCKTNWNDNSQIPMLWDMVYRSLPFSNVASISVGRNGVSPRSFAGDSVKYAFITVPTNDKKGAHKPGSVSVTRVIGLSGGNYWGRATSIGVAQSFAEFLPNNFAAFFSGSIQNHVQSHLDASEGVLEDFLTLRFDVSEQRDLIGKPTQLSLLDESDESLIAQ